MKMKKSIAAMLMGILMITVMIMGSTVTTMAADVPETAVTTAHIKIDKDLNSSAGTLPAYTALNSASWTLTKVGFEAAYDPEGEITDVITPVSGDTTTTVNSSATENAYTVTIPLSPVENNTKQKTGSGIVDINIQNDPNPTDPNAAPFTRPGVYTYLLKENAPSAYYVDYDENNYYINIYVINVVDSETNKPTGKTTIAAITLYEGTNSIGGSVSDTGGTAKKLRQTEAVGSAMTLEYKFENTSHTGDIIFNKRMTGDYADQDNDVATFRISLCDSHYDDAGKDDAGTSTLPPATDNTIRFAVEYYYAGTNNKVSDSDLIKLYGKAEDIVRYIPNHGYYSGESNDEIYTFVKTKQAYTFKIVGVTPDTAVYFGEDKPTKGGTSLTGTTPKIYGTLGYGLSWVEKHRPDYEKIIPDTNKIDGDGNAMISVDVADFADASKTPFTTKYPLWKYTLAGDSTVYYAYNTNAPAGAVNPTEVFAKDSVHNLYLYYINEKNLVTPTGLNITMLPYIIAVVVVLAGMITFIILKKRKNHNRAEGL